MSKRYAVFVFFSIVAGCAKPQVSRTDLDADFFSPTIVTPHSPDAERFAKLSESEKSDLFDARKSLVSLFTVLERGSGDHRLYLASNLLTKFPQPLTLSKALFGEETSLLSVTITGFNMRKEGIDLELYVVIFSEGTIIANEGSAQFMKEGKVWKIANLVGIE